MKRFHTVLPFTLGILTLGSLAACTGPSHYDHGEHAEHGDHDSPASHGSLEHEHSEHAQAVHDAVPQAALAEVRYYLIADG